jgi:hypothetical protein
VSRRKAAPENTQVRTLNEAELLAYLAEQVPRHYPKRDCLGCGGSLPENEAGWSGRWCRPAGIELDRRDPGPGAAVMHRYAESIEHEHDSCVDYGWPISKRLIRWNELASIHAGQQALW